MDKQQNDSTKNQRRDFYLALALLVPVIIAGYSYWSYERPLPPLQPTMANLQLQAQAGEANFTWPGQTQAALGIVNSTILQTHGEQKPLPIASTAKILSALSILQKKPLKLGEQGPLITLNNADVALYNSYVAQDGSVVSVSAGEQISEYQMLETMMLPSANNMADSLVTWAFGSLPAYKSYAENYAKSLGLANTTVGSDASGFSPSTTSTASDLVLLGKAAIQNPVLASIVNQKTADDIPGAGTIKNVNVLLGTDNIVGIKTGNTDQAGGVYVSASTVQENGQPVTIVTAVVGSPTIYSALHDSLPFIVSAQNNFANATIVASKAIVGNYHQPWGPDLPVVASNNLTAQAWQGTSVRATVNLLPINLSAKAKQTVGSITSQKSMFASPETVNVQLTKAPTLPSFWWRFLHP